MRLATREKYYLAMRFVSKALAIYSLIVIALTIAASAARAFPCLGSCGPVTFPAGGGVSCGGRCATYLCSCYLYTNINRYTGVITYSCECD